MSNTENTLPMWRVAEMQCASEVLGLNESRVLDYPDTKLDKVDEDELLDLVLRPASDLGCRT